MGAPYSDSFGPDAGAAYQFDVGVAWAFFAEAEFNVEVWGGPTSDCASVNCDWARRFFLKPV